MTHPLAPTWEPRIVLQMLVASDDASQPRGIMDCVDNDGKPYQSAHMAKLVEHARALVSAPTTIGERQAIAEGATELTDGQAIERLVAASIDGDAGYGEETRKALRAIKAAYADGFKAALRQTLPIHGEMREALEEALIKQENDRTLWTPEWQIWAADARAVLARNALQGDGL